MVGGSSMKVNNIDYSVIEAVTLDTLGNIEVPVLEIPMMSDDQWNNLANSPEQIRLRKLYLQCKDGE